jgi:hypothetical protein
MANHVHHIIRAKGEINPLLRLVKSIQRTGIRFGFTIHHDETQGEDQCKLEATFDLKWNTIDFEKFGNLIKETGIEVFPIEVYFYHEFAQKWGWIQYFDGSGPIYRLPKEEIIHDIAKRLFSDGGNVKDEEWTFDHHFPGIPSLFIKSTWTA